MIYSKSSNLKIQKRRISSLYRALEKTRSNFALLEQWNLSALLGRDVTIESPATFEEMLPLWVGTTAVHPVSAGRIEQYLEYFSGFISEDRFYNLLYDIAGHANEGKITEADLSALHSLVHLMYLVQKEPLNQGKLNILEIGGGYSLLGALIHKHIERDVCYVSIDAVPESCAFSEVFLRNSGLDVCFATKKADLQAMNRECIVSPAWLASGIHDETIDIIVNFSSIQEMPDASVKAYMDAIPRWLRNGGAMLFGNSREYFYAREYRFVPPLYIERKEYSPRSRTLDFPIEVLRKLDAAPDWRQREVEIDYYISLKHKAVEQQEKTNALLRRVRKQLKQAGSTHKDAREDSFERKEEVRSALEERNETLKTRISRQNQSIRNLQGRIEKFVTERRALIEERNALRKEIADIKTRNKESNS